jgi:hypothetical protein
MSLNNKKFGVEIECYIPIEAAPRRSRRSVASYESQSYDEYHGHGSGSKGSVYRAFADRLQRAGLSAAVSEHYQQNYHQNTGDMSSWLIANDTSVAGNFAGFVGVEITSPPLKGKAGLEQLRKVCKILKELGAKSDDHCGLHVHHETDRATFKIEKLSRFFFTHQKTLFDLIKHNRSHNGFCKPLEYAGYTNAHSAAREERRYALNFKPFAQRGTVEFRLHHGTVRFVDISNWVKLTQAIVETSQAPAPRQNAAFDKIKALLDTGPLELDELQRLLSNQGHGATLEFLDAFSKSHASISRVEQGNGKVILMIASAKSQADELIEALNITDVELKTLILGKYHMKKAGMDVDARIVKAG